MSMARAAVTYSPSHPLLVRNPGPAHGSAALAGKSLDTLRQAAMQHHQSPVVEQKVYDSELEQPGQRERPLMIAKSIAMARDLSRLAQSLHPRVTLLPRKHQELLLEMQMFAATPSATRSPAENPPRLDRDLRSIGAAEHHQPSRPPGIPGPGNVVVPPKPTFWCYDPDIPGVPQKCPEEIELEWVLDVERFRVGVWYAMRNAFPGAPFAFAIARSGKVLTGAADGLARHANPKLDMSWSQPVMAASVSKVITGVAVLYALEQSPSISLDSFIYPYFPKFWGRNSNFKLIRFVDCLQYRCGIDFDWPGGQSYDLASTRGFVEDGKWATTTIVKDQIGKPPPPLLYNNACFAWFRLALFYMTAPKDWQDTLDDEVFPLDPNVWHAAISVYYRNYVRAKVFTPGVIADVSPIGLGGDPNLRTLYFPYPCPNPCAGVPMNDHLLLAGGSGWFISAYELARFATRLKQGLIISPSSVNKIFNESSPEDMYIFTNVFKSPHGTVFFKGGAITNTKGILFQFPDNVQFALVSNSNAPSGAIRDLVREVYENSWVWKKI